MSDKSSANPIAAGLGACEENDRDRTMIGRLRGKILGRFGLSVYSVPRGARLSARRRADRTDCDPAFVPSEKIITSTGSRV
uniref:Uncharacterized protein n=1 Tax=Vespula pensylvanica TaxID=30213 RepID=A0A834JY64_VESPE|nr:hypothetical protein H0235_016355 [Vespula pensylvanica]